MTRADERGAPEFIGIDVGATKTHAVRTTAEGRVLGQSRRPTAQHSPDALVDGLVRIVGEVRAPTVAGVGVGLPGMVDPAAGVLTYAPTFPFGAAGVGAPLAAAVGLPVACDNDANAATWAEYLLGAGIGRYAAMVTVGTGLGCGMVVDGRLLRGAHGYAAEVSHLIVEPGGEPCGCGERGCWGIEATGYAIGVRARRSGMAPAEWGVAAEDEITGEVVTRAAQRGHPAAVAILARAGELLGRGLAALANLLDPEVLIVGGGVSEAGDLLLDPARRELAGRLYAAALRPEVPVVAARLGGTAGAVGAALLAAGEHDRAH